MNLYCLGLIGFGDRPNEKVLLEEKAICKMCKQSYPGKSFTGIGHLDRHRKKCEVKHRTSGDPK